MIQRSTKNVIRRNAIARNLWRPLTMTHDERMVLIIGLPLTFVWSFCLGCYAFWPV